MAARTALSALANTDNVASPSTVAPSRRPPCASTLRSIANCISASSAGTRSGDSSHSFVDSTTSVSRTLATPVGVWSSHPARSRSTSSPGVAGRRAGSMARPARSADSNRAATSAGSPAHAGRAPVGAVPVSRAKAVAAKLNTSLARTARPPAATSGARNPDVPPVGAAVNGAEDEPRSTTTMRPVRSRMRFAGLTSPWTSSF
jgi:hypothetical protein